MLVVQRAVEHAASPTVWTPELVHENPLLRSVRVRARGALHDVIEDTATQLHEIQARFGPRIAGMVSGMTEDASISSYAERKAEHRSRVTRTFDVAAIYAADKLAKVRGPGSGRLSEMQLRHYCETHRVLAATHPEIPFLADLREELERLRVRDELIRSIP